MGSERTRPKIRSAALLACALLALLPTAQHARAQTLYTGLGGSFTPGASFGVWLRAEGVRPPAAAPTSVTFEVRGPAPQVGLGLSTNQSFGPVGNLIFEAWGALAPHPTGGAAGEAAVTARGVLGPVALRAVLLAYGADVGVFRPHDLSSDERPSFAGPAGGLQLSLTYRPSREVVIEAAPEAYLSGGGLALRLDTAVRLLRALGRNELLFDAHAYTAPAFSAGAVGVGAAVTFSRGREPDVTVGASLGYSPHGLWPGLRVSGGQRVGGVRLSFEGAFEPYRLDVPAVRLKAGAKLPAGGFLPAGSELLLDAAFAGDLGLGANAPSRAWAGAAIAFPVNLR